MSKLLSANLYRLRKSFIFWLSILIMAGMGVFVLLSQYMDRFKYGYEVQLDNFIFGYSLLIGVVAAVFCSLFLGAEYSDGTIRNKLIVGHTRPAIYLSMLLTSIIAAVLMCLAFLVAICAVGIPLVGFVEIGALPFAMILLDSLIMVCAVCSLLTAVCMLVSNKAIAAIVCILGMIGLLMLALNIYQMLDAPEFYPVMAITENGEFSTNENVPNPNYLRGAARAVYELLFDILPTGQAYQFASMEAVHLWQMPLYSLGIVAASTLAGIIGFQRKDLK